MEGEKHPLVRLVIAVVIDAVADLFCTGIDRGIGVVTILVRRVAISIGIGRAGQVGGVGGLGRRAAGEGQQDDGKRAHGCSG